MPHPAKSDAQECLVELLRLGLFPDRLIDLQQVIRCTLQSASLSRYAAERGGNLLRAEQWRRVQEAAGQLLGKVENRP